MHMPYGCALSIQRYERKRKFMIVLPKSVRKVTKKKNCLKAKSYILMKKKTVLKSWKNDLRLPFLNDLIDVRLFAAAAEMHRVFDRRAAQFVAARRLDNRVGDAVGNRNRNELQQIIDFHLAAFEFLD